MYFARLLVRGSGYSVLNNDKIESLIVGELEYLRNFVQSIGGVTRVRIVKRRIRWRIEKMIEQSVNRIIQRAA